MLVTLFVGQKPYEPKSSDVAVNFARQVVVKLPEGVAKEKFMRELRRHVNGLPHLRMAPRSYHVEFEYQATTAEQTAQTIRRWAQNYVSR